MEFAGDASLPRGPDEDALGNGGCTLIARGPVGAVGGARCCIGTDGGKVSEGGFLPMAFMSWRAGSEAAEIDGTMEVCRDATASTLFLLSSKPREVSLTTGEIFSTTRSALGAVGGLADARCARGAVGGALGPCDTCGVEVDTLNGMGLFCRFGFLQTEDPDDVAIDPN
jgi:hypothetical protein